MPLESRRFLLMFRSHGQRSRSNCWSFVLRVVYSITYDPLLDGSPNLLHWLFSERFSLLLFGLQGESQTTGLFQHCMFTHFEKSPLPLKALRAIEQRRFFSLPNDCDMGIRLYWSSPKTCHTHTFCWAFGCGAVTTCFNDLGLSQLRIEPLSPTCKANILPPHHHSGTTLLNFAPGEHLCFLKFLVYCVF